MEDFKFFIHIPHKYRFVITQDESVNFDKPRIVGCFSTDSERNFKYGNEKLRYFKLPKVYPLDLNKGSENYIPKPQSFFTENTNSILNFLMHHIRGRACYDVADIITNRGILTRIMTVPYFSGSQDAGWTIRVNKNKGKFYISKSRNNIQDKSLLEFDQSEGYKRANMYAKKFEQFCFSDNPNNEPNTSAPVDEGEQFFCVYRQHFCGMNLLYAAEIDGVISNDICDLKWSEDYKKIVETKVEKEGASYTTYWQKMKLLRWWCQSSLIEVENIVVGKRDKNGLIHETPEICKVSSLPNTCEGTWRPNVCVNFLYEFLLKVKEQMKDVDSPHIMYEYAFFPSQRTIGYKVLTDETTDPVLTNHFLEFAS